MRVPAGVLLVVLLLTGGAARGQGDAAEGGTPSLVGTLWRWERLSGAEPIEVGQPVRYTLELAEDGRYAMRADCNRGAGAWERVRDSLRLLPGPMTSAACGPDSLGDRFAALLQRVDRYRLEGGRLLLELPEDGGVMELSAQRPMPLAGTGWLVVAYHDGRSAVRSVLPGTRLQLAFGADGRVFGNAGCNRFSASFTERETALSIGPARSTRKACGAPEGVMAQEAAFLSALSSVARHAREGDRLELRTADGALALELASVVSGVLVAPDGERIPAEAVVRVRVEDVSRSDAPARVLGEDVSRVAEAGSELPFQVGFDPGDVDPRHRYAVRARVTDGAGALLLTSTGSVAVLTQDAPRFDVRVPLEAVAGGGAEGDDAGAADAAADDAGERETD